MTTATLTRGPTAGTPTVALHRVPTFIWSGLIVAALLHLGFNLWISLEADDTENLEMTRVLAAARQFTDGPGSLYGPFSGANPCVLIQAPLYYRLTALGAWPLVAAGVDPVMACLASGRGISLLSFAGILFLAYRLVRLGGATRQAGVFAAVLLLGSPMFGGFQVTMRPDMLGVLLQTAGLYGVAVSLSGSSPRRAGAALVAGYVAFALALVTKQHYIIGPLFGSGLLAWGWWQGRIGIGPIVAAHAAALAVLLGDLALEEAVTGGAMSRAIFVLPGSLRRVTAGSFPHVGLVFIATLERTCGMLVVAGAVAWAIRGRIRAFDVLILAFMGLDLALMAKLCLDSSGGWFNYGLQAAVGLAVLAGRGFATASASGLSGRRGTAIALAALVCCLSVACMVGQGCLNRLRVQAEYREVLADPRVAAVPAAARYFPGHLQHYNIRAGSAPLTHDEWLYRAFEAIGEAEPRERWLRKALTDGPIRLIVAEPDVQEQSRVPGVDEPLTALGFEPVGTIGRLALWQRR